MAKNEGYISVHRCIFDNWIWKDKPFSKGQAWIDLLLLAARQDGTMFYKGEVVKYKKGQVCRSISWLAERWGWSRHKVSDFLDLLEKDSMLHQSRTVKRTVITIENYSLYQNIRTAKRTDDDTTQGHTSDTYNNIYTHTILEDINTSNNKLPITTNYIKNNKLPNTKNKKDIDINIINNIENEELRKAVKDFIDHRKALKAEMTPQAFTRFMNNLDKLASTDEEKIMIIDQSIFYGWKGVFEIKDEYRKLVEKKDEPKEYDPLYEIYK